MLTDIYLNYKEYCLIFVEHFYERKNTYQYLTNINPYIVILTDTYQYWKQAICMGQLVIGQ